MAGHLPVYMYGTLMGKLRKGQGRDVVFESGTEGTARFGIASTVLSNSLPLGPRPSTAADASAFFGGLLPEGRGLVNLAAQARCGTADLYEMLEYAGMDVAGALQVGNKAGSDAGSGLTRWTAHPPRTSSSRSRKNLLPCSMLKHIAWKMAAAAG